MQNHLQLPILVLCVLSSVSGRSVVPLLGEEFVERENTATANKPIKETETLKAVDGQHALSEADNSLNRSNHSDQPVVLHVVMRRGNVTEELNSDSVSNPNVNRRSILSFLRPLSIVPRLFKKTISAVVRIGHKVMPKTVDLAKSAVVHVGKQLYDKAYDVGANVVSDIALKKINSDEKANDAPNIN